MRTTHRLTSSERWELGLFMVMLFAGCLALTAILNLNSVPRLFATEPDADIAAPSIGTPSIAAPETLEQPTPAAPEFAPPPVQPTVATPPKSTPPAPKATRTVSAPAPDIKVYNGKKYRYVKTLRLRVTAYAPDPRCCWPYPGTTTATGLSVKTNRGRLVAADPRLIPMHSLVSVPGYNNAIAVPVLDTGGDIKGHRLDVLLPTYQSAKEWGAKLLDVKVYKPVD